MVSNFDPVALLTTSTVAPGNTPPPSSRTTPAMVEVAPPCASAGAVPSHNSEERSTTAADTKVMEPPKAKGEPTRNRIYARGGCASTSAVVMFVQLRSSRSMEVHREGSLRRRDRRPVRRDHVRSSQFQGRVRYQRTVHGDGNRDAC